MEQFEKQAMALFLEHRKASASLLQRRLGITYRVAAQIMGNLEAKGLLTKADQNGRRKIIGTVPPMPVEPQDAATASPDDETPARASTLDLPIEVGDDDDEGSYEMPAYLRRPRRQQGDWRPIATGVAVEATRTVLAAMERGIGRYSSAIAQIDSVGDPRMHLLFACLATGLFAFGQFLGGVCIIAYGLIVFAAGGARK